MRDGETGGRTWLVRTRVKLVVSVETRSQVTMLGPTVVQPCVWLGSVTWYASAEAASAASARTVRMMKGCKGGGKRVLQGRRARRGRSEGRKERGDVEDAGVKRGGCWALAGSGLKRRKTGRDGGHPSPARRHTWLDPRSHSPQRRREHTQPPSSHNTLHPRTAEHVLREYIPPGCQVDKSAAIVDSQRVC